MSHSHICPDQRATDESPEANVDHACNGAATALDIVPVIGLLNHDHWNHPSSSIFRIASTTASFEYHFHSMSLANFLFFSSDLSEYPTFFTAVAAFCNHEEMPENNSSGHLLKIHESEGLASDWRNFHMDVPE